MIEVTIAYVGIHWVLGASFTVVNSVQRSMRATYWQVATHELAQWQDAIAGSGDEDSFSAWVSELKNVLPDPTVQSEGEGIILCWVYCGKQCLNSSAPT